MERSFHTRFIPQFLPQQPSRSHLLLCSYRFRQRQHPNILPPNLPHESSTNCHLDRFRFHHRLLNSLSPRQHLLLQSCSRLLGSGGYGDSKVHQQTGILLLTSRARNFRRYSHSHNTSTVDQDPYATKETKDRSWRAFNHGCIVSSPALAYILYLTKAAYASSASFGCNHSVFYSTTQI